MPHVDQISFPPFAGIRCLMLPYVQGEPASVPERYRTGYDDILRTVYVKPGDIGYLTIDESVAEAGKPHRGAHARFARALHTEAGRHPDRQYAWGGGWGSSHRVTLDADVRVLIANSLDNTCAVWDVEHRNTSIDGDIGDCAEQYPYAEAHFMRAGEVYEIGILTPHESLPVRETLQRQFLRIVSSGVHGREPYFTVNELMR